VDDLLATLAVLVMIEQQAVLWALSIYVPPTLPVFYAVTLSIQTIVWYILHIRALSHRGYFRSVG
jgi:hypothetical protein